MVLTDHFPYLVELAVTLDVKYWTADIVNFRSSRDIRTIIVENRVFVPAYLFRQANLTVQLNQNTLSITENKFRYLKNLDILNSFRRGFLDYFEKLDQETMNLLGDIILNEKGDTTVLLELLDALTDNAKHNNVDSLSIIIDKPDGFTVAISCSESYSNAPR